MQAMSAMLSNSEQIPARGELTRWLKADIRTIGVHELFTFSVLICRMTPRRALIVGLWVTFVVGVILAGYNGTAIYVWHTTGKVQFLGRLRDSAFSPFLYTKSLTWNFIGLAFGAFVLILVPFRAVTFWKALRKSKP